MSASIVLEFNIDANYYSADTSPENTITAGGEQHLAQTATHLHNQTIAENISAAALAQNNGSTVADPSLPSSQPVVQNAYQDVRHLH